MSDTTKSTTSSEQRMRYNATLLEYVNDAVISMDMKLVIQSWNKAAVQLYGWSEEDAIGKRLVELLKSEYPKDSREAAIEILAEKGWYEGELVHRHKDGTRITILSSISVLKGAAGEAIGFVAINRDITGRQTAGEALRWWAHVFEHLDWGVVIGGENNTLALMNPAFARMHGWTVEELTGRPVGDVFAPEARAEVPGHIAIAHKEGHHSFEAIHIRKDGSRFPVLINLTAVKDKEGTVLYRAASVFDITEQKKAQKTIEDSEQRYRYMFESASVAMFECDVSALKRAIDRLREEGVTDFRQYLVEHPSFVVEAVDSIILKDVNDRSVELFEAADKADLMRSLPRTFVPETYERLGEMVLALANDRDHFESETVFRTLSGKRLYTYFYASVPPAKSPFENPLISIVDITDRRRTEEAFLKTQFAIDHAADALFWIQPDGLITEVNNAACEYLGYTRDELLTMRFNDIDPLERDWETSWEELESKGSITTESSHTRKDGRRVPVEVVSNYLNYHGREFNCAFVRDNTERKALEAQLHQAQRLETIGTLAGGIAHDFNNILGPILGYTDMLLEDQEEGSQIKADLERILKSAYRAKDLVQQILLFGRRGERERQPVHIHLVVREAMKLLEATIPSSIKLEQVIDSECGVVSADPTQIHQILFNLCANAQHAMRESGGVLAVGLHRFEPDESFVKMNPGLEKGPLVELTVSDTGHGIDRATMERIFEPFFTTKQVGEGTGLGLSVAHGIVVSHGGTMTVESSPGEGTTFRVYLPRAEASAAEMTAIPEPDAAAGESVLFVEDREDVAAMGKTMLNRLGYNVTISNTGTDALEVFRQNPARFDLVLTDQAMPGLKGTDLARELLQIRPDLPIVLVTGFSDVGSPESAKRMGIRGFVRKPMVTRELARVLRNALGSGRNSGS